MYFKIEENEKLVISQQQIKINSSEHIRNDLGYQAEFQRQFA